ncbi:hypothetical protein N431DRAFT_464134 [Stipitochalara longipes BDJ]|nr:hypothetical protein N431DRAFT_464134 [Stipitochalara longipes BDJ]
MDPERDVLLFHDTHALDVFAATCQRTDSATPPSLAKIKYIMIDPRGIYSPCYKRKYRGTEYDCTAYRFKEIAATYGSINEIVVLKSSKSTHSRATRGYFGHFPGQLSHLNFEAHVVDSHLRLLLRLSVQHQYSTQYLRLGDLMHGDHTLLGGINTHYQDPAA